jgi:hypothetical protein
MDVALPLKWATFRVFLDTTLVTCTASLTQSSHRKAADARCHILALPAELRLRILEMVIGIRRWHIQGDDEKIVPGNMRVLDSSVHVQECHLCDASGAVDPTQQCLKPLNGMACERQAKDPDCTDTALLLVCRQFYEDAAKLKWQNHVFQIAPFQSYKDKIGRFLGQLSEWQRKAIRTLHVHYFLGKRPALFESRVALHRIHEMAGLQTLIVNPVAGYLNQRSREKLWNTIKPQLMSLRLLSMDLDGVRILACGWSIVSLHSPPFIDLTEVWRQCIVDTQDRGEDSEFTYLAGD